MVIPVLGWFLFLLLIWVPVEKALGAYCFNNYDLGIYAQALQLISWQQINPFLSTRDVNIFNDHFDPILLFIAPLRSYVSPELLAVRIEMISIIIASIAPLWLKGKSYVDKNSAHCAFGVILFSPMTLNAVLYPSHPGTWSLAPLAWMMAFIFSGKYFPAGVSLLVLMSCKEEYPILGAFIGMILLFYRKKPAGITFLFMSILWGIGVFAVRPLVWGRSDFYTSAVLGASGLTMSSIAEASIELGKILLWVFIPSLCLNSKVSKYVKWRFVDLNFALPFMTAIILLAIRMLGGYWGNHRAAPLAIAAAFMILSLWPENIFTLKRMLVFCFTLLIFAFPSLELGSRYWRGKPFKKHCSPSIARVQAISEAIEILKNGKATRVLAQGNLVPHLVSLAGIAQVGATKGTEFRYFFVEKSIFRSTWPLSAADFQKIEFKWRIGPNVKVVRDDEHVLLLESSDSGAF